MKILKGIGGVVVWAVKKVGGLVSGAGNVAATTVETSIESVGGRKMLLALLTMVYVPLCFYFLKMPSELILASIGPLLAFIGVEGVRDIRASTKDPS